MATYRASRQARIEPDMAVQWVTAKSYKAVFHRIESSAPVRSWAKQSGATSRKKGASVSLMCTAPLVRPIWTRRFRAGDRQGGTSLCAQSAWRTSFHAPRHEQLRNKVHCDWRVEVPCSVLVLTCASTARQTLLFRNPNEAPHPRRSHRSVRCRTDEAARLGDDGQLGRVRDFRPTSS